MFCRGEDGYHFNIKMVNPTTGEETNKKVNSMNFDAYRLMIRLDVDNHLLRYHRLFQQYCVDMYVNVITERLNFIRFNQSKFGQTSTFTCVTLSLLKDTRPTSVV
ncbi:uncharacterized protein [Drosophila kikkawai]|uniref:Helitron helicase-like domain-containing protein n=1 Tax=Drosophila kikkawai TaxID=30033 RepID=A0ABM4GE64_DROKI